MQPLPIDILLAGWIAWILPFFLIKRGGGKPQQLDRRARWGIALQGVGYALVWQGRFWRASPSSGRIIAASLFLALAPALSWTSARTLGRQWRLDAGLNPDHELVRENAYRFVRHPIYSSMLCLLIGTGFMLARPLVLLAAIAVHVAGTEIRVHVEDALLAARFGERFRKYQRQVPAYIPLLR